MPHHLQDQSCWSVLCHISHRGRHSQGTILIGLRSVSLLGRQSSSEMDTEEVILRCLFHMWSSQTCSADSLRELQLARSPLEWRRPELPPCLAYSTATSATELLIHSTATEPCKRIQCDKLLLCYLCDGVLFSQQRWGRLPEPNHSHNTEGNPLCRRRIRPLTFWALLKLDASFCEMCTSLDTTWTFNVLAKYSLFQCPSALWQLLHQTGSQRLWVATANVPTEILISQDVRAIAMVATVATGVTLTQGAVFCLEMPPGIRRCTQYDCSMY